MDTAVSFAVQVFLEQQFHRKFFFFNQPRVICAGGLSNWNMEAVAPSEHPLPDDKIVVHAALMHS